MADAAAVSAIHSARLEWIQRLQTIWLRPTLNGGEGVFGGLSDHTAEHW